MMTHSTNFARGGEKPVYAAPTVETLDIRVEKGFAGSDEVINYGSEGDPGNTIDDTDYGTF